MKKLIAISVMIALIAGAVFADTSVMGAVETRMTLLSATSGEEYDAVIGGSIGAAQIGLRGSNDDGTLNGTFNLRNQDIVRSAPWFHKAYINWKPIEQVNVYLGIDQDGKFATDALEGWAFNQGADDYISFQAWDYWRAIYPGNWDGFGMAFSLYVVDGLDLNIVLPTGNMNWPQATNAQVTNSVYYIRDREQLYDKGEGKDSPFLSDFRIQAGYGLPDIGKVMFSYVGPWDKKNDYGDFGLLGSVPSGSTFADNAFGQFALSFLVDKLVDGLSIHPGVSFQLAKSNDYFEYNPPILFGLAAHYQAGDLGLKFRSGYAIGTGDNEQVDVRFEIMPWYNLGSMMVFCNIGLTMGKNAKDDDTAAGFFLNPYVRVPISGGQFRAGMAVRKNIAGQGNTSLASKAKDALKDADLQIAIPMMLAFNF